MYQRLILYGLPRIRFAHVYESAHYQMDFPVQPRVLECTYFEKGEAVFRWPDGREERIPEGSVRLTRYEEPFGVSSPSPLCRHVTVGFEAAYTAEKLTREDILAREPRGYRAPSRGLEVLCPPGGLLAGETGAVEKLLRRLVADHVVEGPAGELSCLGRLLELLGAYTAATERTAFFQSRDISPAAALYVQRAVRYIAAHLSEKISLRDIARELRIGAPYLSTIFKTYTGRTVVGYIQAQRVERIKELISTRRMRLGEAGKSVGLEDENYTSRLFKQYTGMTARDFQRMHALAAWKESQAADGRLQGE